MIGSFLAPTTNERAGYGPEARALDTTANVWAWAILDAQGYGGRCQTGSAEFDSQCLEAARAEALRRIARVMQQPDPNGPTPIYGDWQAVVLLAREVAARLGIEGATFDPSPYAPGGRYAMQTARVSVFADVNSNSPAEWSRTFTVLRDDAGNAIVPPTIQAQLKAIGDCERALRDATRETGGALFGHNVDREAAFEAYRQCVGPIFEALPPTGSVLIEQTEPVDAFDVTQTGGAGLDVTGATDATETTDANGYDLAEDVWPGAEGDGTTGETPAQIEAPERSVLKSPNPWLVVAVAVGAGIVLRKVFG